MRSQHRQDYEVVAEKVRRADEDELDRMMAESELL
jgi:hypothetical protein